MSRSNHLLGAVAPAALLNAVAGAGFFPGVDVARTGVVTIICRNPGMRRLGITHPATESYPLDRWTTDELEILRSDPAFSVRVELESSAAPGADTSDAVQDNGAGPVTPDLGAKPGGLGPDAGAVVAGEPLRAPVFDDARISAIRAQISKLADVFGPLDREEREAGERYDYSVLSAEHWTQIEQLVGFRPTPDELEEMLRRERPEFLDAGPELDARLGSIRSAIGGLTPGADFTQDGRPLVARLEAALGFKPSRAEIDAALAAEAGLPTATN